MISKSTEQMIPIIRNFFAGQPVKKAWLFGSCSRGEETEDSDVDILVQYENSKKLSLFAIAKMMCALEVLVGREVDMVEYGRLRPFAVDSVDRDKILIYERKN